MLATRDFENFVKSLPLDALIQPSGDDDTSWIIIIPKLGKNT